MCNVPSTASFAHNVSAYATAIKKSMLCNRYQYLWTIDKPEYLSQNKNQNEKLKTIARFSCGCEERWNRYWKEEKDSKIRRKIVHLKNKLRLIN